MNDRERLLAKIRSENEEESVFERDSSRISWTVGSIVGVAIAVFVFLFELIICGRQNYGLFLVVTAIMSVKFFIEAIKNKDRESIIFAVAGGVAFLLVTVLYVLAFLYGEI